jgi:hypothetical protein
VDRLPNTSGASSDAERKLPELLARWHRHRDEPCLARVAPAFSEHNISQRLLAEPNSIFGIDLWSAKRVRHRDASFVLTPTAFDATSRRPISRERGLGLARYDESHCPRSLSSKGKAAPWQKGAPHSGADLVNNPLRCGVRTGNGIAVPLTSKHAGKLAATVPSIARFPPARRGDFGQGRRERSGLAFRILT